MGQTICLVMLQGGMKAVLWADTIQFFIMLAGQMAIVIRGTMMVGGPSEVLRIAKDGSRINFMELVDKGWMLVLVLWLEHRIKKIALCIQC